MVRGASRRRVAVFDVDGTLTTIPDSWRYYHEALGTWSIAREHARLFFSGAISYDEWAKLDVGLWRGAPLSRVAELARSVPWRRGAELLARLKESGYLLIAITTGLWELASRTLTELGFDYAVANRLEVDGRGLLTGSMEVNVEYWGKGEALRRLLESIGHVEPELVVAVGDGRPDVKLFEVADVAVAFNPSSRDVEAYADVSIRSEGLEPVYSLLRGLACSARRRATTCRRLS